MRKKKSRFLGSPSAGSGSLGMTHKKAHGTENVPWLLGALAGFQVGLEVFREKFHGAQQWRPRHID